MKKDREVELVDSREVEVDLMEKEVDLTILYKIRLNLSEKMMTKARLSGKVEVPIKEVIVYSKEEAILTLGLLFMVNVLDVVKKGIDTCKASTLIKVKAVAETL